MPSLLYGQFLRMLRSRLRVTVILQLEGRIAAVARAGQPGLGYSTSMMRKVMSSCWGTEAGCHCGRQTAEAATTPRPDARVGHEDPAPAVIAEGFAGGVLGFVKPSV